MKRLAALAGAVTLSLVLAGCGSASYSYEVGSHDGQALAAIASNGSLVATRAPAACRHEWAIAGSVSLIRGPWLQGCIRGFDAVANGVG
jgi:hypothetical protein